MSGKRKHVVASLDDIEGVPGAEGMTWHPVRRHLGIRAFGTNAYSAAEVGQDVVEPHDEKPEGDEPGHEELYFVARGRARFTVDGDTFDAPAGTYVFIPDPGSHRHAVAEEAGTTVLSFGGPPSFTPSDWEFEWASEQFWSDDPARAREILEEGRALHPASGSIAYGFACLHTAQGDLDAAFAELEEAIRRKPRIREWVKEDADLEPLRGDSRFGELTS